MAAQQHPVFFRLGKIAQGPTSALIAARHNLRELPQAPNIDAKKTALNHVLCGANSAVGVQAEYDTVLAQHGIGKLRKDAVRLIEALVSLPVGMDDSHHQYFEAALQWLGTEFGKANILSAVIHKDEAAQHMHVLIIPLLEGGMRGSEMMGGRGVLKDRHARFSRDMQQQWGSLAGVAQRRAHLRKQDMTEAVTAHLRRTCDPLWQSRVVQVVRDCIASNPEPFYEMLGLAHGTCVPTKAPARPARVRKPRTMAQIFTRPVKRLRSDVVERYRQSQAYGRAHAAALRQPVALRAVPAQPAPQAMHDKAHGLGAMALPQAAQPPVATRTLCSVGFVAVGAMTAVSVRPIPIECSADPSAHPHAWARSVALGACLRQYASIQCREQHTSADEVACLPLQCKLLHWWLTKARRVRWRLPLETG